jgi:hypothetical protein
MLFFLVLALPYAGRAEQRNVLVEMFTNSHCGLCPPAHAALGAFAVNNPNAQFVRYIYYHMAFPYPDDPLYQANTADPAARNNYYGPFSATPVTFFDGSNAGTAYADWSAVLNARVAVPSPLEISLSGSVQGSAVSVTASISRNGPAPPGPLTLHMVAVENVSYTGRNGVSPQDHVMRSMITGPAGEPFAIADGETKYVTRSAVLSNVTSVASAGVVVFVQDDASRSVLQSEYIPAGLLTGVEEIEPRGYRLEQNFPNPFNATTTLVYSVPVAGRISLEVFDMLGCSVALLAEGPVAAGQYRVSFDGTDRASGVYVVRLIAGAAAVSRTMVLLR